MIFKPTKPWFSNSFFSEPDRLATGLAATFSSRSSLPDNFDQQPPARDTGFLLDAIMSVKHLAFRHLHHLDSAVLMRQQSCQPASRQLSTGLTCTDEIAEIGCDDSGRCRTRRESRADTGASWRGRGGVNIQGKESAYRGSLRG